MRLLVKLVDTESNVHCAIWSWNQGLIDVLIEASGCKVNAIFAGDVIGYYEMPQSLSIGRI